MRRCWMTLRLVLSYLVGEGVLVNFLDEAVAERVGDFEGTSDDAFG
jgi:hypothetical protein